MNDTAARLLRLLSLLQTGREWPGSELAERLEVSPRTIRRDVDRLRRLGYPVDGSLGAAGGYRLVAGAAMPPLLLDDDEAVAIAVGLRVAAVSAVEGIESSAVRALAKVLQVLPGHLRHQVEALGKSTTVMDLARGGPHVDPDVLSAIAAAIANGDRLRFKYSTGSGVASERRVDARGLVSSGRRWYLVGFDIDRDDWRSFRVDRMHEPRAIGGQGPARELPAASPAEFLEARLLDAAPTYHAVAVLHAPLGDVAARLGDGTGQLEAIDDRSCRVRLEADTLDWLTLRLTLLGCEFVIEEPTELIEHVREFGARITRAGGPSARS